MTFDHYVSLGRNCEPAFQLRRVLGKDHSGFFSWNVTTIASLVQLLENRFDGIMRSENLVYEGKGSLVRDRAYEYYFHWVHSDFSLIDSDGPVLRDHQEKASYFVKKFAELVSSRESKVLFYLTEELGAREKSLEVVDLLVNRFSAKNFRLVILQPKDRQESDWGIQHISNRYLDRLAPWADATDGHVKSWDAVFREFPHRDPLRLAGF